MLLRLVPPLVIILSFFILLFAYTKIAGPIPFSVSSVTTAKSDTFNVTGEGKSTVVPDTATITAGISAGAATVKGAQNQINTVINKVSEAVKRTGVEDKDIQTANYNVYPDYDYSGPTQKITGYSASTNLQIKVRNLDTINNVIDAATQNGANQVSGLNFEIEDKTQAENEARQKAVDEAKKKAQSAASIAGFRLGRIINYSENFGGMPRPITLMRAMSKEAGAPDTQIEPGSTDVTVVVTLSYEIQ